MNRKFLQRALRQVVLLPSLLLYALGAAQVHATVLQELTFEELVTQSQLVFRGVVLRTETEAADGLVYTRVWFRVDEVLRGEAPADEFPLRFVGGTDASSQVEVAGQYLPAVGAHAVWFVRDAYESMVNPLTGWHQGAFPIETAADGRQLLDLSGRPDLILFNTRADPLARKMLGAGFSEERIEARVPEYQRFPLQDFLDAIRSIGGTP
jgi:hypothetical protein